MHNFAHIICQLTRFVTCRYYLITPLGYLAIKNNYPDAYIHYNTLYTQLATLLIL